MALFLKNIHQSKVRKGYCEKDSMGFITDVMTSNVYCLTMTLKYKVCLL